MGTEFALLCQRAVQRQYTVALFGRLEVKQRVVAASVGRSIHPGSNAILVVDPHRFTGSLEHEGFVGGRNLTAYLVPARFGEVSVRGKVRVVPHIAAVLLGHSLDQCRIDLQALEHGIVSPAGVAVDAVEHQGLIGPAPLIEHLAQFAAFFPVG
ncbi:hypothetical protein D3C77_475370 [compost metagenome]